jgi:hypothetical protein
MQRDYGFLFSVSDPWACFAVFPTTRRGSIAWNAETEKKNPYLSDRVDV